MRISTGMCLLLLFVCLFVCLFTILFTELFKWLDQNKDGYLDIVEMAKGVAYLCRFENTKRIQS